MSDFYLEGGVGLAEEPDTRQASKPAESAAAAEWDNVSTGPLYFDLETVPDWSRFDSFGLDPLPPIPDELASDKMPPIADVVKGTVDQVKLALRSLPGPAPAAWLDHLVEAESEGKNRSGVLDAINEARQVRQRVIEAHAERIKLLSVTPEFCSIAAMGVAVGNGDIESLVVGKGDITEADILERWWELCSDCSPLVGFNCLAFDHPVLLVRSAILGVASSRIFDARPWGGHILDLYAARYPRGSSGKQPGRLKSMAAIYGIEVPAGDMDGSDVHELMREGSPESLAKVEAYVRSDVAITRAIHRRLAGYFWS